MNTSATDESASNSRPSSAKAIRHSNSFMFRFGKPLTAFVLYSAVSLIGLHYLAAHLDYEQERIRAHRRFAELNKELEYWEAIDAASISPPTSTLPSNNSIQKTASSIWSWFIQSSSPTA
ncbi:hypothetical protein HK100_011385 [Physocladia obscura]|uniref:Uncharacterized protein n=1 Tax=Physocladia obscura TaxID=109957 RepID=A0AAD5TAU5_9FUNG|nr:hypothetical protein HK100_011385 [Physocladia obscura]